MRITTFLLFAAVLHVSANSSAQNISISTENSTIEQFFSQLNKKLPDYSFLIENGLIDQGKRVQVHLQNATLEQVLDQALTPLALAYRIDGKIVYIVKKKEEQAMQDQNAPPGDIQGRITNDKGEPLANANVIIKRTRTGTVTNAKGEFILKNVNAADEIVVSFVGYKPQTVKVGDRKNISLLMEAATDELDKVVVQAYGTTTQRLATGNIGVVRAEDIAKQPVMNVLQAVQGQVPGVVVTSTSGYASGTVKVEIRGRNTINPNFPSDPLYIIDGVPLTILDITNQSSYASGAQGVIQSGLISPANGQSPFFSINPADIESVEVLKDADATAIYGSRGSNGVILITTKKGRAGKTHVDVSAYTGISKVSRHYQLLNTQQYVAMRREALANDGIIPDVNSAPDITVWDTTQYTDWQKYLWGNLGRSTDVQASISGGDTRTTFRVGAGYHHLAEILVSSGSNQRGSLSLNLNHKSLNQRFGMTFSGTYTLVNITTIYTPGVITLPPNAPPVKNNQGKYNFAGWYPLNYLFQFGYLSMPYNSRTNLLNSNLTLSYEIIKGLTAKTSLGYNNAQSEQSFLQPVSTQDPIYSPQGVATFGNSLFHNVIIEPQLEYSTFIGKGKLNVLAGASHQQNTTSGIYMNGIGFTNDALLSSIGNALRQYSNNNKGEYKYGAIFGRINYNWENKYILNVNARRDGSSKFAPGRQFGNFASAGAAWIFSEEHLVKTGIPWLSFGKLRASYGTTGGDEIAEYSYLSLWGFNTSTYNNILPLSPQRHTDSLLHWQVNRKLEAAIDLGFLKDRITLSVSWYRNRCNDQLVGFPTPALTGFISVTSNSPANVQNTGLEIVTNAKILDGKRFKWDLKFNIGINRNKLLAYPNFSQSPYSALLSIGKPLNMRRLLHWTGVDPQTGAYTFEDRNHDGKISIDYTARTEDDRYIIDLSTKFDGGLTNNFSYKNWQLSFFFYFRKQLAPNVFNVMNAAGDITNQPERVLGRWQKPGDITNIARFTTNPYNTGPWFRNFQNSDAVYTDGSFIRLRNLYLSYTVPQKVFKKAGLNNIRLYAQGENLLTITHYEGLDPEIPFFGSLPNPKIITLGLSCNF